MKYRIRSKASYRKEVFVIQYRKNWFYCWQPLIGFRRKGTGPIEFSSLKDAIARVERRKEIAGRNKTNKEKWRVVWRS